jgi:hypothetical protein
MTSNPMTSNPYLLGDRRKNIARTGAAQERLAPIATGSEEMQIAAAVNASQACGHGPALYKPEFKTGAADGFAVLPSEPHGG